VDGGRLTVDGGQVVERQSFKSAQTTKSSVCLITTFHRKERETPDEGCGFIETQILETRPNFADVT
jgi:hypothetical protein